MGLAPGPTVSSRDRAQLVSSGVALLRPISCWCRARPPGLHSWRSESDLFGTSSSKSSTEWCQSHPMDSRYHRGMEHPRAGPRRNLDHGGATTDPRPAPFRPLNPLVQKPPIVRRIEARVEPFSSGERSVDARRESRFVGESKNLGPRIDRPFVKLSEC